MEPKGGQASRLPPLPIQAWQGDACRSHDSALLRSPESPFADLRGFRERSFSRGAAENAENFLKMTESQGVALP
jgi:hypothetical protein